jgi:hypothetical protein
MVPPEGATLRCTSCQATFHTLPPDAAADRFAIALDDMRRLRESAELRVLQLEQELTRRQTPTPHRTSTPAPTPAPFVSPLMLAEELQTLINSLPAMQWGLDQTVSYLEAFSADQPVLAAHVRQLQLLRAVLTRLAAFAKS